ncbi:MAG: UBP-type zinc finger domain-containing protein [Cyclobacteriaceae bacterium]
MAVAGKKCTHMETISQPRKGKKYECDECVKTGDRWVHLRVCQYCGITLCCDSSPNKHASKHALSHNHPVAASAEPGENWMWCYEDKVFYQY